MASVVSQLMLEKLFFNIELNAIAPAIAFLRSYILNSAYPVPHLSNHPQKKLLL